MENNSRGKSTYLLLKKKPLKLWQREFIAAITLAINIGVYGVQPQGDIRRPGEFVISTVASFLNVDVIAWLCQ